MKTVIQIAVDCFRFLLRQRLLVALVIAAIGLSVVFSLVLTWAEQRFLLNSVAAEEEISESEDAAIQEQSLQQAEAVGSIVLALFYWCVGMCGTLVALFVCSNAIATDIRRGTICIVMARSVSRAQYLLGRFMGAAAVLAAYSAIVAAAVVLFAYANQLQHLGGELGFAPWLMFCEHLMAGSVALLLATMMRPLLAAVVALFASASMLPTWFPLYFVLPSYDRFSVARPLFTGALSEPLDRAMLTLYAFDVVAIALLLAYWRFKKQAIA